MQTTAAPHPVRAWLLGGTAIAATLALFWLMAQPFPDPVLAVTNTSTLPMSIAVSGDRVQIIGGGDTDFLVLPVAVWAFPRDITVSVWPDGPVVLEWEADLTDLADNQWQLRVP